MKNKILLSITTFLFISASANAGIYLAGEYSYTKSKAASDFMNGVSSGAPAAYLGWGFGKGDKGGMPSWGLEAGWKKHEWEDSLTLLGTAYSLKIEDTIYSFGARYWFSYFSLKGGILFQQLTGTGSGLTVGDSETGYYIGGGVNVPLGSRFSLYADVGYLILFTDFAALEFAGGARFMF